MGHVKGTQWLVWRPSKSVFCCRNCKFRYLNSLFICLIAIVESTAEVQVEGSETLCHICYDEVDAATITSLSCGHKFCSGITPLLLLLPFSLYYAMQCNEWGLKQTKWLEAQKVTPNEFCIELLNTAAAQSVVESLLCFKSLLVLPNLNNAMKSILMQHFFCIQ